MKKQHVQLTESDEKILIALTTGKELPSRRKRAIVLLELNQGKTYKAAAAKAGVTQSIASKYAKKYQANGLDFLKDNPRPGRPPLINGADRAKLTALACSNPPEGYRQWSLRLLANRVVELDEVELDSISPSQVGRILKKMNSNHT